VPPTAAYDAQLRRVEAELGPDLVAPKVVEGEDRADLDDRDVDESGELAVDHEEDEDEQERDAMSRCVASCRGDASANGGERDREEKPQVLATGALEVTIVGPRLVELSEEELFRRGRAARFFVISCAPSGVFHRAVRPTPHVHGQDHRAAASGRPLGADDCLAPAGG
jgi:hypothetical protein